MQERRKSNGIAIILERVEASGSSTRIRVRTQNFTTKKYSSLLEQRSGRDVFLGAGCYELMILAGDKQQSFYYPARF